MSSTSNKDSMVLLIAGPAASGKTSMAQFIASLDGWKLVSEDDVWDEIGHPPDELREDADQIVVHERVHRKILEHLADGMNVVLEFILFHNPPEPLFQYQKFFLENQIRFETRVLRPALDCLVQRAIERGRESDCSGIEMFRQNATHQLACISNVNAEWVVDNSVQSLAASFEHNFRSIVQTRDAAQKIV